MEGARRGGRGFGGRAHRGRGSHRGGGREHEGRTNSHGNYLRYYGYRSPAGKEDPRIPLLDPSWFRSKRVLDVGCNTGDLTLTIAARFLPKHVLGLDIDPIIIKQANARLKKLQRDPTGSQFGKLWRDSLAAHPPGSPSTSVNSGSVSTVPMSGSTIPMDTHEDSSQKAEWFASSRERIAPALNPLGFPMGLAFRCEDFGDSPFFPDDGLFDTVMCFSTTKWIQYNSGDVGLKRSLHKMVCHVKVGGIFILEPQPWRSYKPKQLTTETMRRNYKEINFRPTQFVEFIVGLGLRHLETRTPEKTTQGFDRPVHIFEKTSETPELLLEEAGSEAIEDGERPAKRARVAEAESVV